ncbi:MAG: TIGR02099 family protein [Proteobacteria bacterium]|nr:TIGR02099 family protein [Pseudomonadota bacterium]
MKNILRRLIKFIAYMAAGIVILLAIAVGLFRLFLPRLPEYQEEIKGWAGAAIGMHVEFSGMDARWGLSGPELKFYDAELIWQDSGMPVVAAKEVRIGVGVMSLLVDRKLVVDRVVVRGATINVRERADGSYEIQGRAVDELLDIRFGAGERRSGVEFIGEDLAVRFMQAREQRSRYFVIPQVSVSIDDKRIAVDADIRLPEDLGRRLTVFATQVLGVPEAERSWDINVDADDISLSGWSRLLPGEKFFQSGVGDLELAWAFRNGRVTNATAELDFIDIAILDQEFFDVSGRVELDVSNDGWLIAADDFVIAIGDHKWPKSDLRVEASVDGEGRVVMLDVRASYLNLDDLIALAPWLDTMPRQLLTDYAPSGIVRDLVATVSEIDSDEPRFNVSAELDRVGIADAPGRPGVRGFSGLLRANRSGGRLEIDSTDLVVSFRDYLADAVKIDFAEGTIIWRNGNDRTTILSDSIAIESEFFASQSNVHLIIYKDGASPEIDLASTWSITDIAEVKRYIPHKIIKPKMYDWFQMALVSGAIPRGVTLLSGPLDKFPFEDGEGRFRIDAAVRNMTLKYHPLWPATEQSDMDVVLENTRLYTVQNSSISAGIAVINAQLDIPDLRNPVLKIKSFSTGTLAAIREFSILSPINNILGGQLDRVSVSGDASFTLDLTVPLKNVNDFEFIARIRSNNGTLAIDGLSAPITNLIGDVTIERDQISSESLGGTFLGQSIVISLDRSEDPRFTVVATVDGIITADGLINELGLPLEGLVSGAARYQARILFPKAATETPTPLTVQIKSEFEGFAFDFPEPIGKPAESKLRVSGNIRFMPGGEVIESAGLAENNMAWQLAFTHPNGPWDFDRGVVALGGEVIEAAATRGLHIRGNTGVVRLEEWLSLSRGGEKKTGAADRIRSIDLVIDDLFIVGQHLRGHRVRVDRSSRDWLVQIEGEDIVGSVFVPYDFGGDRPMVFEMEKMRLPGEEAERDSSNNLDPRKLPPMTLSVKDFSFGDRHLGAVEATILKIADGLEATAISSTDETFEITGTGRWVVDDKDPLGSHSFVTATLTSTNVEATMARLNYQPGIASDAMSMLFDLDWSGSPRADFFEVLDGNLQVRFGKGQLEEVDPGAGRMFGLMSIVALPRRLSLDFRDVFAKGFGFDEVAGSFRIVAGKTYTCDLSLESPAAAIGIVGQADLVNRTYDQTAIVSANVGNSLPIVGAVVAGPQVAAALLIFSQIFKKPLQEVGQVYYSIGGSWDEPVVDATNSAAFVASGDLAGCLQEQE